MTLFYILCGISLIVFGFFAWALCVAASRGDKHMDYPRPITDEEVEARR